MENPFKKIINNESVSEKLRRKVINSVSLISFSMGFEDILTLESPLFIRKFLLTEGKFDKN